MDKKDDNIPEMIKIYKDSRRCKYWFLICLLEKICILKKKCILEDTEKIK